jgi:Transcriptional regulators
MLDRESKLPIYIQLKNELINKIKNGELKQGSPVATEQELCAEYGISRYPIRQAMEELVKEGYLTRTRGRGTFVSNELPEAFNPEKRKLLGLVMGYLTTGLCGQILRGFEKQAGKRGYLTVPCSMESVDDESNSIEMLAKAEVSGIFVFPCDKSKLAEMLPMLNNKGIYLGLLDRNLGISGLDYIGSDNFGGAYTAVRHLQMQGFRDVVFISDKSNASSVNERMEGYLRAVSDFGLNAIPHINVDADLEKYPYVMHRFFLEKLKDNLIELRKHVPLGIFAINDGVALQCMEILQKEGFIIGTDVGIVGFDNMVECEYADTPLTSVAQNGLLIGQSAAEIAIDKIEGKLSTVFKSVIPTQLVVRSSCGEKTGRKL